MYEGNNTVTFSNETANRLFGKFMSGLFHSPIKITGIEKDYKGVTIDFTEDTEGCGNAKQPEEVIEESEVV